MRRAREVFLLAAPPIAFLSLFFLLPLFAMLSYLAGRGETGPWEALRTVFATPYYRNRIEFTLELAAVSTLLILAAALPFAYLFSHYRFPGRALLRALFTVPFVLPAIVVALALHAFIGPRGLVEGDLLNRLGPYGAVLAAHVFYNFGLVQRLVGNYWSRLPLEPVEAARVLGATRWQAFVRVELPLLAPAVLSASLLVFAFCASSFGVVLLLGSERLQTLEVLVWQGAKDPFPQNSLLSILVLLQLVITFTALALFAWLQSRARLALTPQVAASLPRLPALGYAVLLLPTVAIAGPLVALVRASLRFHGQWSTRAFELVLSGSGTDTSLAIRNSLTFATLAALLAITLGLFAGLATQRARAWAHALLLMPLGVSSVVIGYGTFLTWNGAGRFPDLRGTATAIVLAHALIAFPLAARVLAPTLEAIEPRLREAAQTLGAPPREILRRIDFPLAYPALGVAAVYAWGASLGEFGATLLLRSRETTTIPIEIYHNFNRIGFEAQAVALAVILLVAALISFLLLERLRVRAWGEFA